MESDHQKMLGIYLQDHLAGAMTGSSLAKRILEQNEGNEFGEVMRGVVTEIEQDRQTLIEIMDKLGVERSQVKETLGWLGEKLTRLKMNGELRNYSPLSRFIEIETMMLGVSGKLALWRALDHVAGGFPTLDRAELERLIGRAEEQRDTLEQLRLRAAEIAFLGESERAKPVSETQTTQQGPARAG